jgi:uncharacterized membrane protein YgdD (TMEM256/DUF423 family)
MNKFYTVAGGIFGLLGVGLGAFGAHGLRGILTSEMMELFRTGILYQLIHAVAIIAIAINSRKFDTSCLFFTAGIILFSISLFLYAVTEIKLFAMITPIGGLSFLFGWGMIIVTGLKNNGGRDSSVAPLPLNDKMGCG